MCAFSLVVVIVTDNCLMTKCNRHIEITFFKFMLTIVGIYLFDYIEMFEQQQQNTPTTVKIVALSTRLIIVWLLLWIA